ncbi:MAG: DNA-binding SARP family transcriptional activator [Verrucomicrobiales bacterium]
MNSDSEVASVRIGVLGSFKLWVDGEEIVVPRAQVRIVLARLAITTGRVSVKALTDLLWGDDLLWVDDRPKNERAALRTVLSRCRDALGAEAQLLTSEHDSFELDVGSDLTEFEFLTLSEHENSENQIAALEKALTLIRGLPFSGFDDVPWFSRREVDAREALRRAEQNLVGLYGAAGKDEDAVKLGRRLLQENPVDEDLAVLVAISLSQLGRRTEAIGQLDLTRRALRDKGLEPAARHRQVEADILRGGLDLGRSVVIEPETSVSRGFVGRKAELRQLVDAGDINFTVVLGEAGIGKTELLNEYQRATSASGGTVIFVTASSSPKRPNETIGLLFEKLLDAGMQPRPEHAGAVSMLVPQRLEDPGSRPASRDALIASSVDFIRTACLDLGAVIVIDDAQWLDAASKLAIERLVESQSCRVVVSSRLGLSRELLERAGRGGADTIQRAPLSASASGEFVSQELGHVDATIVGDLHHRSGGNPLFLRLLIDLSLDEVDYDAALPPVVLLAVQRRLDSLSQEGRRVLQVASVFGQDFLLSALEEVVPLPVTGIGEAVRMGLVVESQTEAAYSFSHALVAEGAYQLLSNGERVALHDEVGRALERAGGSSTLVWPHCREAAELDLNRAVEMAGSASEVYLGSYDWDAARDCTAWAIEALAEQPGEPAHGLLIAQARA